MKKLFTNHPAKVGETYFEHFGVATSFGFRMISGGLACVLHGVFPFMFETTGSRKVSHLHDIMVVNRRRRKDAGGDESGDVSCNESGDPLSDPASDLPPGPAPDPAIAKLEDHPHAGFAHAVFAEL